MSADDADAPTPCPTCRGVGWVLIPQTGGGPLVVDLLPCDDPDCLSTARPIEVLAVHGSFARAVLGPGRAVMSLTGARPPHETALPVARQTAPRTAGRQVPDLPALPPGARPTGPSTS